MSTRVVTAFPPQAPTAGNGSNPVEAPARPPGRVRRVGALVLTGLVIGFLAFMYDPRNLFDDTAAVDSTPLRDTGTATLSSLTEEYTVDGTVSFRDAVTITLRTDPGGNSPTVQGAQSTSADTAVVTQMVAPGTDVYLGYIVWRIGLQPTVVLVGPDPAYRTLDRDTEGPDVRQLEESLVEIGFDPDGAVTVDESFTAQTETMVERWQEAIDAEITGEVNLSDIIYIDEPSRIGAVAVAVGDAVRDGSAMLDITSLEREITFTVAAADRETLDVGDPVEARLPDGATITATITEMTINDSGGAVVKALPEQTIESSIDTVPITVTWVVNLGDDLLTVPAAALVRTDSGQYYVETRAADNAEQFVAVSVGLSSRGRVEISGDISVGDIVVTP